MPYYQTTRWSTSKRSEYNGYIYDSGFEANYAQELDLRKRAKDIKDWERQVKLELIVNGYIVTTYKIDFVIHHNDDTIEYVETKGFMVPEWKLKWKLFCALYQDLPNVKISLVQQGKQRPPKIRKSLKYK